MDTHLFQLINAFARVYVGVHYPADTVVGLLLGAGVGAIVVWGLHKPANRLVRRLAGTRLRPLIIAPDAGEPAGAASRRRDRAVTCGE